MLSLQSEYTGRERVLLTLVADAGKPNLPIGDFVIGDFSKRHLGHFKGMACGQGGKCRAYIKRPAVVVAVHCGHQTGGSIGNERLGQHCVKPYKVQSQPDLHRRSFRVLFEG